MAEKPKAASSGRAVGKRRKGGSNSGKAGKTFLKAGDKLLDMGKQLLKNGKQHLTIKQKPSAASQKPSAVSRKPQVSSQKPQAASKKPQVSSQKPQAASKKKRHAFPIRIQFPGSNMTKLTIKAGITAAALIAAMTLMIVGADLRPSEIIQGVKDKQAFFRASGSGYPIEIHGSRMVRTGNVTRGTAVLTDASYTLYDGKGREVVTANHHFASPSMECAGKYSLLFDRPGKEFILRNLTGIACSGMLEDSIICADVSESGRFVLVTNSELINAFVNVFSREGQSLYKWKSVENKISDVTISPSGKYIALSGVSTKQGAMVCTVIVQEVGTRKNIREFRFEDTLIVDIRFDGKSRIAAVGDDAAYFLDIRNGEVQEYSYNGRTLNSYDISGSGEIALVLSENSDGRNSSVTVINNSCSEIAVIETSMTSPFVELDRNRVNLLCQNTVTRYDFTDNTVGEYDVQVDCQEIFTSEGKLLAKGVMYLSEID